MTAVRAPEAEAPVAPGPGPAPVRPGPRPARPTSDGPWAARLRRLWFVPAAVALLGAAALLPSVGGGGPGPGEARLDVNGTAVVTTVEGARRTVRDGRTDVGPGDRVEVTEGTTRFEMADGVRLEGTGGRAADGTSRPGTTVVMAVDPRLEAGPLLAVGPRPVEVRAGDHRVTVAPTDAADGVARLDRRIGLGVGSYAGAVTVTSAGRTAPLAPLRRIEVAAPGAVGGRPLPLRYDADDAWDRRYLGDALAIDAQLGPLLASSEALASTFLDDVVLADAVPGLPSGVGLRDRLTALDDGGDALVLAAIAVTAGGSDADAARSWDRAAAFHATGAPWGLVALDRGARSEQVLAVVRGALDTLDLAAPRPASDEGTGATTGAAPPSTTTADAGPTADAAPPADAAAEGTDAGTTDAGGPPAETSGGSGGGGGGGGPTAAPPSVPLPPVTTPTVPGTVGGVGGAVGGTVGGVVDGATGGVDRLLPGAGGAVGGAVDGVGGVVSGAAGAVGEVGGAVPGPVGGTVGAVGGILGGIGAGLGGGGG